MLVLSEIEYQTLTRIVKQLNEEGSTISLECFTIV
jgi:hypothetical protein